MTGALPDLLHFFLPPPFFVPTAPPSLLNTHLSLQSSAVSRTLSFCSRLIPSDPQPPVHNLNSYKVQADLPGSVSCSLIAHQPVGLGGLFLFILVSIFCFVRSVTQHFVYHSPFFTPYHPNPEILNQITLLKSTFPHFYFLTRLGSHYSFPF